jgi:hypothetical protein
VDASFNVLFTLKACRDGRGRKREEVRRGRIYRASQNRGKVQHVRAESENQKQPLSVAGKRIQLTQYSARSQLILRLPQRCVKHLAELVEKNQSRYREMRALTE